MRRILSGFMLIIVLLFLAVFNGGVVHPSIALQGTTVATTNATQASGVTEFDGDAAFAYAKAQVDFGVRPTGSEASVKTGDYIITTLKAAGWTVEEQPFSLDINGKAIQARNITGKIGVGSGPVLLFGAHYDTRLWANKDPDPNMREQPILGANDGASGVAVLLELAQVLGHGYKFNREIWLVFFDAEDNGDIPGWDNWSLGATYYADHLQTRPQDMILLDMIGDKDLNIYYEAFSAKSAPDLVQEIWTIAGDLGYADNFIKEQRYSLADDHLPFIQKGIRAVDIIDFDYPYHHTLADTLDKISAESLGKVGRVMQTYLEQSRAVDRVGT